MSHTLVAHQEEMNIGEADSEPQSLASTHSNEQTNEKEKGKQQGGIASKVQT